MPHRLLKPDEISRRHSDVPNWRATDKTLALSITLPSFPEAINFVNKVAHLAEQANHHPDIDIRHRTVKLVLTTHSAGGLTDADFSLAEFIDKLQN